MRQQPFFLWFYQITQRQWLAEAPGQLSCTGAGSASGMPHAFEQQALLMHRGTGHTHGLIPASLGHAVQIPPSATATPVAMQSPGGLSSDAC